MTERLETPAELHADHRHWNREISMWQDDIEQWRVQHEYALEQLEQAAELIRQHGKALDDHVASVEKIANGLEFHEKNLTGSLQTGSAPDLDVALLERHVKQNASFSRQREIHERIKKHHHVAMAHVASANAALQADM